MMSALTSLVLRLYPSTWRLRYEEELRALLAQNPPDLRDLAGLARAAVAERWYDVIDPAEHPVLAGVVLGLGGWMTAWVVIAASAHGAAGILAPSLGTAPDWAGVAGGIGILAVFVRALVAQPYAFSEWTAGIAGGPVVLRPLSRLESKLCWSVLLLSVVLGLWARIPLVTSVWLPPFWFWCVVTLWRSDESGWARARATLDLRRLRAELGCAIREYQRVSTCVGRGLVTADGADAALREIDRINRDVQQAGREYRRAQLRHLPANRPLGL